MRAIFQFLLEENPNSNKASLKISFQVALRKRVFKQISRKVAETAEPQTSK